MSDIGIGEIAVILVVALLVFGPDKLPTMIKQAASFVSDLRKMVTSARRDLTESVGDLGIDEQDLKMLTDLRNPKSYLRQKVLDGVDPKDLGLDEFEELGEQLELPGRNKRRPSANGTTRRSGAATKPAAKNTTKPATKSATKPASRAESPSTTEPSGSAPAEAVRASATDTAGDPTPAPSNPVTAPSGARFDPETT
ncbi:Sec-independent protein translocase protein TatB [Phytoactinopolyspora limicola]|uniref:Sec-independent protein translocase protein TatB n=1 Tax=Phytoactinopolyspora limicola TaxID=2715536 RepID=UPI001409E536|nr:Sec-independent protein translocase protein TatB [Phytoactinopolyspora limicola]